MLAVATLFGWLESSLLSQEMRGSLWLYPIVEIVHILGFVLLAGAIAMFDFRVLGMSKNLPVQRLGKHVLRWSLLGAVIVVPTGLLMFAAHPKDFIENELFLIKLGLIALAALNAILFHAGAYRSVEQWDMLVEAPAVARMQALLSLCLWIAVISCGRLLAYT